MTSGYLILLNIKLYYVSNRYVILVDFTLFSIKMKRLGLNDELISLRDNLRKFSEA